jgi:hypothetical protein
MDERPIGATIVRVRSRGSPLKIPVRLTGNVGRRAPTLTFVILTACSRDRKSLERNLSVRLCLIRDPGWSTMAGVCNHLRFKRGYQVSGQPARRGDWRRRTLSIPYWWEIASGKPPGRHNDEIRA